MNIAVWRGYHYCVRCILQCCVVVITMLDVYCSVLWLTYIFWIIVAMCHYYVGCIFQYAVFLITMLDVY